MFHPHIASVGFFVEIKKIRKNIGIAIFRSINLFVAIVGIWIYTYSLIQNLNQTHDNKNPKKVHLNNVSVFASLVFLLAEFLICIWH